MKLSHGLVIYTLLCTIYINVAQAEICGPHQGLGDSCYESLFKNFHGTINYKLSDNLELMDFYDDFLLAKKEVESAQELISQINEKIKAYSIYLDNLHVNKKTIESIIKDIQSNTENSVSIINESKNKNIELNKTLLVAQEEMEDASLLYTARALKKKLANTKLLNTVEQIDRQILNIQKAQKKYDELWKICLQSMSKDQCEKETEVLDAQEQINKEKQKKKNLDERYEIAKLEMDNASNELQVAELDKDKKELKVSQIIEKISMNKQIINQNEVVLRDLSVKAQEINIELGKVEADIVKNKNTLNEYNEKYVLENKKLKDAQLELSKRTSIYNNHLFELVEKMRKTNALMIKKGYDLGTSDGLRMAYDLGNSMGAQDGAYLGGKSGELLGKEREYSAGEAQGEIDGDLKAKSKGSEDGFFLGVQQGNQFAGKLAGSKQGESLAISSDAHNVGQAQGAQAGLKRAVKVGEDEGAKLGEVEAIKSSESTNLKVITINGPFAGAFQSYSLPNYPGLKIDIVELSSKNCLQYEEKLIRQSCISGFSLGYITKHEVSFNDNIFTHYDSAYIASFDLEKDKAFKKFYEESYNEGRKKSESDTFKLKYLEYKERVQSSQFLITKESPDINSLDYKNSFNLSKEEAYKKKYEEIKFNSFTEYELKSFENNIASETEKSKNKRIIEIRAIYNENSILKYEESSILDAGVKGVAVLDGIFQPGEDIIYDLVIKNYGSKPANSVKVNLSNGTTSSLPIIPGNSIAIIKGAAKFKIDANIGEKVAPKLTLHKKLTSAEPRIEGKYFEDIQGSILAIDATKSVRVLYPIEISQLKLDGDLLYGKTLKATGTILNRSKKAVQRPVYYEIKSSLGSKVIKKGVKRLGNVEGVVNIKGAEILVADRDFVYDKLTLSVTVLKAGIVIGQKDVVFQELVKVPFSDKKHVPILVTDSRLGTDNIKDVFANYGGIQDFSVLDIAIEEGSNSKKLLKGFRDKLVIVAQDKVDSSLTSLLLKGIQKSSNSFFIFVDRKSTALMNLLNSSNLFDNSTKIPFSLRDSSVFDIVSVNNFTNKISGKVHASQIDVEALQTFTKIARNIALDKEDLLEELIAKVTIDNYISPDENSELAIKSLNFNIIDELLKINHAYVTSEDNESYFFKKNNSWLERLRKNGKNLIIREFEKRKFDPVINLVALNINSMSDLVIDNSVVLKDRLHEDVKEVMKSTVKTIGEINMTILKEYDNNLYDRIKELSHADFSPFEI